jgi:hypothetical protein
VVVPEEMNDFYSLPPRVLDEIRRYLTPDLPVRIEGPAQVSLFAYNNGTFVVESFLDYPVGVRVIGPFAHLENLTNGVTLGGDPLAPRDAFFGSVARSGGSVAARQYGYELLIEPHSFVAFREQP